MTQSQINDHLRDLYQIKPIRIIGELVVYGILSWMFFVLFLIEPSLKRLPLFVLAIVFNYRGLSFIHEVSHFYHTIPKLTNAYNLFFGFMHKVPAYSLKTHKFHHGLKSFGTPEDPEYESWTEKPKYFLLRPFFFSFFYPFLLVFRFGLLPLFLYLMPQRYQLKVFTSASSFVMNLKYQRPYTEKDFQDCKTQDLLCSFVFLFQVTILLYFNVLLIIYIFWHLMITIISLMNTYRALVAHRYLAHKKASLSFDDQLQDSITIEGHFLTKIWAPIGLQYHSTHHFLPGLPYYSLGKAHERLKKILPHDHPYHQTIEPGFVSAFTKLYNCCSKS